jgi:DNA invertase Pin-like site-specific DNA recombinase
MSWQCFEEIAMKSVVAYTRTSSATNVGADKDSLSRQRDAVDGYASTNDMKIVQEFYDPAVSGADPVDERPMFVAMLRYCETHEIKTILVENASRFARDLMVQLTGHSLLKKQGIELIPVDAPSYFTDPTPTAVLIQQILGAVSQFEKAALVAKLKAARDRKRAATGRCEGRKAANPDAAAMARMTRAQYPEMSLRSISNVLGDNGYLAPGGSNYTASSISAMLRTS